MKYTEEEKDIARCIEKAAVALDEADALLINTGAGMGVDSGLPDFRGKSGFWRAYPAIEKRGLAFEQMADPRWFDRDPRLAWGFYGHRLNIYRRTRPHAGYAQLLSLGRQKSHGYAVLTSNVDGQFQLAGFERDRIEECHGSIHHLQCAKPCREDIWSAEELDIAVDSESLQVIGAPPACPRCRDIARPNILMFSDGNWVPHRSREQGERLWQWLEELLVAGKRLVVLEIGAGLAVPTIRNRSEFYVKVHQATLIRINPDERVSCKKRRIVLPMGGKDAIQAIGQRLNI